MFGEEYAVLFGLDTSIFIGISVWGLEGAKNTNQKAHHTYFFDPT